MIYRLYSPETISNEKFTESYIFDFLDFQIKSLFSKCLLIYIEKEVNFDHREKIIFLAVAFSGEAREL